VSGTRSFRPVWVPSRDAAPGAPSFARRLVLLCDPPADWRAAVEGGDADCDCVVLHSDRAGADERYAMTVSRLLSELQRLMTGRRPGNTLVQVVSLGADALQFAPGVIGLLRTAHLEDPGIHGQTIELDEWPGAEELRHLLRTGGEQVAYRGGAAWVRGWEEAPAAERVPPCWKEGGVYLVTGGVGGLARLFARDAREHGAHGVLAGRAECDVTDRAAVDALLASIVSAHGRLDGILHCAGLIEDAWIIRKTHQSLRRVLAPKVQGTLNLDLASRHLPLDFLALFSSNAGSLGNAGQADYAAANGFLDTYAAWRDGRHGRTVSIAWPLWAEGGMRAEGHAAISAAAGLQAFHRCVASGWAHVRVSAAPAAVHEGEHGLARDAARSSPSAAAQAEEAEVEAIEVEAAQVEPVEVEPVEVDGVEAEVDGVEAATAGAAADVLHVLKELFASVIKRPVESIDAGEALERYGIDSIVVTRLNQRLEARFGPLPKTLFYQHPTLAALARHLEERSAPPARPAARPAPAPAREPIAIIGIAGRYPQAPTLDAFWRNLEAGRDCVTEVPADRWPLDGFYEPDPARAVRQGKSYSKWGGFLDGIADFDPLFFNIAPRDAAQMDPQERLFLEACWEVVEDAGYTRASLAARHGGRVGVFAGVTKSAALRFPRSTFASIPNRVSYVFDFRGPSLPVDTMCSSSLTAIHEACEQIFRGECEVAIAGAVNLYVHPSAYVELCAQQMLSPRGRCRSFGLGADGFVPGEGVGCVLLKPLSRALADGDHVHAVIRGTAVGHGGRTHGYTVPSPGAQAALIRGALERAGVHPRDVSCIEAHGTGTELGDPVEVAALADAFGTAGGQSCALGSAKSNIGHLEAAAGMAGLTKLVLQMRHGRLAPTLHADEANPNIDFAASPFVLQRQGAEWARPRVAGVSSFGAGGTNAHVVVEEYVAPVPRTRAPRAVPVPLSARTGEALLAYARKLLDALARGEHDLEDLAWTLQTGREPMEERLCCVVSSPDELREAMRAFVEGVPCAALHRGTAAVPRETLARIDADPRLAGLLDGWRRGGDMAPVAALWVKGLPVPWERLQRGEPRRRVGLPTYPFTRRRCWPDDGGASPRKTILDHLAHALQVPPEEIDPRRPFADYGLDSILGVRLVESLNQAFGTALDTTTLFDHATLERLERHVALARPAAGAAGERAAEAPARDPFPEPIAVVGMAGRFAGAADLGELWEHLRRGADLVEDATRWPLPPGVACRSGGFLADVDRFDPLFFNISGVEATYMDPQQRLFLEEAWHALEDAGYAGDRPAEPGCGVYVGCCAGDYHALVGDDAPGHALWGNMASVVASRISYHLDLEGPAVSVDTSCSSSLVALHLACEALRRGEIGMALAGGVFVQSTPRLYLSADRAGMLSPTGRCRAFDDGADGFVPGEGVGVVVLKRLADALRDGDTVHGVIRGSGMNQDGTTNGITAPSARSQTRLLRRVYEGHGIDPGGIQVVEAHGTGTKLGDPIELRALVDAFGGAGPASCALGSVKTNLGHTQFAAGIAGVLKVLLALRHRQIPPSLHFARGNRNLRLEGTPFFVNTGLREWVAGDDGTRRAAVSSFGASGTNAHVVIEEAPPPPPRAASRAECVLGLSAASQEQLREMAADLLRHCRAHPDLDVHDLCFTLQTGRRRFPTRLELPVRDRDDAVAALERWLAGGETRPSLAPAEGNAGDAGRRRIPLPGYRFRRDRFWVEGAAPLAAPLAAPPPAAPLADHRVQGREVMPGVVALERVRAATQAARFQDVAWVAPIHDARVSVQVEGGAFRLVGADGTVHVTGVAHREPSAAPAPVDLAALRRACGRGLLSSRECYDALRAMGIEHGPSLQAIDEVHLGDGQVLARLRLPPAAPPSASPWHPALVDGAIQASVGLASDAGGTAVPFALDAFDGWRACGDQMWAHVRDAGGTLDIDLVDDGGRVCVRMRGYTSRVVQPRAEAMLLVPVWEVAAPGPAQAAEEEAEESLPWTAPPSDGDLQGPVLALFRHVQALLRDEADARALALTVLTRASDPGHAAVHGLAGSLAREYPQWKVRLVDVEGDGVPDLAGLPFDPLARPWAWRGGEWLRQKLVPVRAGERTGAAPYRQGGVYVVIGGAGGVGSVWSEWVIRRHQARVVWIGRRPADAAMEARLDTLGTLGPRPLYIRADAADPQALRRARDEVRARCGRVDGVVHSAIVLQDGSLARMPEERFRAALRAKVDVSVALAEVFQDDDLDFVLFFSSIQSFFRAAGQGNYAAGCTFQDAFAQRAAARFRCPVKTMNWGWWGRVGVVASEPYQARMARAGQASIEGDEAMAALEVLLAGPFTQLAFVKTSDPRTLTGFSDDEAVTILPDAPAAPAAPPHAPDHAERIAALRRRVGAQTAEMDPLLLPLLRAGLREVERTRVLPVYARWLEQTDRVLAAAEAPAADPAAPWAAWGARRAEWMRDESRAPHATLVEATLRALPEILTGGRRATDVIFPGSSLALVEGIYRGNPAADFFNEVVAETVAAHVAAAERPVRILEIGAGTGGTSAAVFARLRPLRDRVDTYCYTDVSRAFLLHARERYDAPYLDTRLFDVEKPPADQGIEPGSFDVVVATNVLHATRSIRATLRNAKAALRRNGLLVLNELSADVLFSHLTFGLLEGWWRYDDPALRIAGSPAVAPETWRSVLAAEGFRDVAFPVAAAHDLGQQVIAATSDGTVRQPRRAAPAPGADDRGLHERATRFFTTIVADTLKIATADIDPAAPLERYGIDSLLVVQLTTALRAVIAPVSSTLLFEVRTIDALAGHFIATRRGEVERLVQAAPPPPVSQPRPAGGGAVAAARPEEPRTSALDVAIVGVAGRYPGAETLGEFWENLKAGRDCVTEIPPDRWDHARWFDPEKGAEGKTYTRWGGFLRGADEFDPLFFHVSPREAAALDPQERLFLQCAYEALEDGGYAGSPACTEAGVFVGVMYSEYQLWGVEETRSGRPTVLPGSLSSIANRVSYFLDAGGPSLAVDTMCASSLTAIHLACAALGRGECTMAIAGGVNLSLHPNKYLMIGQGQFAASDGRCRSFGAGGDGYVPGEGVGAVLLKPLGRALADGDSIYGVIRGSAVNHGGRTNGFTVPNPLAQGAAIGRALRQAGVDASAVSYVEAHGTGTALGDPIEIRALAKTFRRGRCAIGSVKSNIGHCEGAAGIAGLTKVLLQMKHGQLVPSLHSAELNPRLELDGTPFVVQQALAPWPGPRVAGVSAFGAGGANAHLVVEEFRGERPEPPATPAPYGIVLSAREAPQLREVAARLARAVERGDTGGDLAAVAYTLQVGRPAMEHRLALAVETPGELGEKLRRWLAGEEGIGGLCQGRARRGREAAAGEGEGSAGAVHPPRGRGAWEALLARWVGGVDVDWTRLYPGGHPRRVSLPTYPFARERHWAPRGGPAVPERERPLHPLVHRNSSDVAELRFTSRFPGTEPLLAHFAGAAYLEMARAAATLAAGIDEARPWGVRLEDVAWTEPPASDGAPLTLHVGLQSTSDDELRYEVRADGDDPRVHARGRVRLDGVDVPSPQPPARLARALARTLSGPEVYQRLGTADDGAHRPIASVAVGERALLARLAPPAAAGAHGYVLHPALLGGALQAAEAWRVLVEGRAPAAGGDAPRTLARLELLGPCPAQPWAYVRSSDDAATLDVDLLDDDGRVCVRMRGFGATQGESLPSGHLVLVPVARGEADEPRGGTPSLELDGGDSAAGIARRLASSAPVEHLVWRAPDPPPFDLSPEGAQALIDASRRAVVAAYRLVRALLAAGYGERPLTLSALTHDHPAHGGVDAILETAAKEHPRWRIAGARRELLPVSFATKPPPPFRSGGVYVVIGGAGAIGRAVTGQLLRRYGARVVWIGRRPLDATIRAAIERLAGEGPAPLYLSADAGDERALRRALAEVTQRHPRIHGVIHAAMVFSQQTLAELDEDALSASLAAKAATAVRMAQVFDGQPLDFVVFFSSLVSFIRNRGQGHYAAGCGFTDAFARHLARAWSCPVKSMHWGYWGNDAMGVEEIEQLRAVGLELIDPEAGMDALEDLLAGPLDALGLVRTHRPVAIEGVSAAEAVVVHPPYAAMAPLPPAAPRAVPAEAVAAVRGGAAAAFDGMIAEILASQLARLRGTRTIPLYGRWMEQSARMLEDAGAPRPLEALWEAWAARKEGWAPAQAGVAEAALRALPEILTGRRPATEVLFPDASVGLVEGIYRGNPVADYFGETLAGTLAAYLGAHGAGPVRVLEVGAGTGGTTTAVLRALQPHGGRIAEYCYTDVSRAFLLHGRDTFGAAHPFLAVRPFDVRQPPERQGIDAGAYDVVIAANVLHATPDIRRTLRNVKATLKAGGLLLLDELSAHTLFNHVTFGLLEGWWLAQDTELRIPGCPGLMPAAWRRLLEEEGFRFVCFPAEEAHALGQQIIAARSDGVVRRQRPARPRTDAPPAERRMP
jgi:acyl transferase domain-containing protein/SAM-dependent methyltransferase